VDPEDGEPLHELVVISGGACELHPTFGALDAFCYFPTEQRECRRTLQAKRRGCGIESLFGRVHLGNELAAAVHVGAVHRAPGAPTQHVGQHWMIGGAGHRAGGLGPAQRRLTQRHAVDIRSQYESKGQIDLAGFGGPRDDRADVVQLRNETLHPLELIASAQMWRRNFGECHVVLRVVPSDQLSIGGAGLEPLLRVLTDRFEKPVASRFRRLFCNHQRLVDELRQEVENVERVEVVVAGNCLRRVECELSGEHCKPIKQDSLWGTE
jgi:hypothetical protein